MILGVSGGEHPILLYKDNNVPMGLSTDDEGVARIDLTHEYVRAAATYDLSYDELKTMSFDTLRYSFLPEAEKAAALADLEGRFAAFEARF